MFALPAINIFVIVMFLLFIIKYCINKFIKSNNKKAEVDKEDDEDLENYLSHEKYYNNVLSELEKMNVEVQDEDFSYKDSDIRTNTMSRMTDINNNEKIGKDSHEEETNVKEQVNSVNNVRKITVL